MFNRKIHAPGNNTQPHVMSIATLIECGYTPHLDRIVDKHAVVKFNHPNKVAVERTLPLDMLPKELVDGYHLRHGVSVRDKPLRRIHIH